MGIFNLQPEDDILKKLLLFTIALVLMLFVPSQAADVNTVKAAIVKHSIEMGVDPAITLSIAKVESGYKHETKSPYGAVGVFQLMPSTARRMGLNPYLLDDNIKGGVMYYKSMYQMFGSIELAVAAYNAGPVCVKKYKSVPPLPETKKFVSRIMSSYYYLKAHTDPAVTTYYKAKKEKEAALAKAKSPAKPEVKQTVTASVPEEAAKSTPAVSPQIVAKAPVPKVNEHKTIKAPVPEVKECPSETEEAVEI